MYLCLSLAILSLATFTQAVDPRELPSHLCDIFDIESGVGYKANPDNCGKFIQCKKDDFSDAIIVYDKECNDGLFWNQKLKNCVPFPLSDCYKGECVNSTYTFASRSCGAYFNCTDDVVSTGCCPRNTPAFDANTKRCVFSTTCKYNCDRNATDVDHACRDTYRVHYDSNGNVNPCKYNVHEGESSVKVMSCSAGTNFNSNRCDCSILASDPCPSAGTKNPCDADFSLNFGGNLVKDVAGGAWIDNMGGVSIEGEKAKFSGIPQQRLAVNRFSNIDFGLPLALKIKFRDTGRQSNMAVLSTGGFISEPGLYVVAGNGRVTLGVIPQQSGYSKPLETSVTTSGINGWKEVVLHYDGYRIAGVIRTFDSNGFNVIDSTDFPEVALPTVETQRILAVDGALQVGFAYGDKFPDFVGEIDEVKVWIGCNDVTNPREF